MMAGGVRIASMRLPRVRLELLIILGAICCVAVLGVLSYSAGPFRYSSVCNRCGAVRQTTERQFPRTHFTFFSRSVERATPVSLSLTTNRVVGSHSHQWIFAEGGGNGVRCALGRADRLRSTVESTRVAQLIETLERYKEPAFRDKVLTNLFDEATSDVVPMLPIPGGGFSDAVQLHDWITEQSDNFDGVVREIRRIRQKK